MKASRLWQRGLLLFLGCLVAVGGMVTNSRAASPRSSFLNSIVDSGTGLQIAAKEKQALIVTFPWFAEAPYSVTRSILENRGIKVVVASSSVDPIPGYENKLKVRPDMLLNQVLSDEYDVIVFIGGARYPGDNADAIRIAKEGAAKGKVLAATGDGAVFTLAKADVLKGKKIASHLPDFWLQKTEATLSTAPIEQDGGIITASTTEPQKFAETIAAALTAGVE